MFTWLYTSPNVRKRIFGHVRLAKIQISLCIYAAWSAASRGEFWIAKDVKFIHTGNKESDQIARIRRMIWVFVGRTRQKVRFLS